MLNLLHLITDLDVGGTETFLSRLVDRMDRARFRNVAVALNGDGIIADRIRRSGIEVLSLGMARGGTDVRAVMRLVRILRRERPHLIHSWLYHADMLGLVAGKIAGVKCIAWNIRCSDMDMKLYSGRTALLRRVLAVASRMPQAVVCNSEAGRAFHESIGYRPHHWEVIENGVDTDQFKSDPAARNRIREELGVSPATPLIGVVARHDPMKGHANFLCAVTGLRDVEIVFVGRGMETGNDALGRLITPDHPPIHLLGERSDIVDILSALDIFCMPSGFGEGFPNALVEAMSCGVPCVATDVGDAARLVGSGGIIVPPADPDFLGKGIAEYIDLGVEGRARIGDAARERVIRNFDIDLSVKRYEDFYCDLTSTPDART
ncbi:MAG: glycosyltransferase [Rhodospirillales bacterium]|nr:glycosyltransferase [Rhodospirillales bacterium]